jgi:hypothetical protein
MQQMTCSEGREAVARHVDDAAVRFRRSFLKSSNRCKALQINGGLAACDFGQLGTLNN